MTAPSRTPIMSVPSLDELAGNPYIAVNLTPDVARILHARCVAILTALLPCLLSPPAIDLAVARESEPTLLAPQEAAARFKVSKRWLLAHAHEIPGTIALSRKTIRFDAVRLVRWLDRHHKLA